MPQPCTVNAARPPRTPSGLINLLPPPAAAAAAAAAALPPSTPRAAHLPTADTPALQAVRDAWFSECGGQPNGNRREWTALGALWHLPCLIC